MTTMTLPPMPETLCIGQARLTAGLDRMDRVDLTAYHSIFGKLPRLTIEELISVTERVDLRGRGGAAFPVARKLKATQTAVKARRRPPVVVVNATEGEPGSYKDKMLLRKSPYLVLAARWSRPGR
jgi:NADH:ubiquinone oxidoreductase subunit F (NADH-binding)